MKKIIIWSVLIALLTVSVLGCTKKEQPKQTQKEQVEWRNFPLPSFKELFTKLDYLKDADYTKSLPKEIYTVEPTVYQASFALGVLTADAILSVQAKNKTNLIDISQKMIEYSNLVGIDEQVLKLADELKNYIEKEAWTMLEESLDKYHRDVQSGLWKAKRYDVFTLMQLGGWMEGLNRISYLVNNNYKADYTSVVNERGLLNSLIQNMQLIDNKKITEADYYKVAFTNIGQIKSVIYNTEDSKYTKEQLMSLEKLTGEILKAVK
ncbi:MAG: hypothetical protein P9L91_03415 [Candidatus Zophobacter franzmannii]|nr:hypothetical protein [Candidatus Zophobacter franzmannii]